MFILEVFNHFLFHFFCQSRRLIDYCFVGRLNIMQVSSRSLNVDILQKINGHVCSFSCCTRCRNLNQISSAAVRWGHFRSLAQKQQRNIQTIQDDGWWSHCSIWIFKKVFFWGTLKNLRYTVLLPLIHFGSKHQVRVQWFSNYLTKWSSWADLDRKSIHMHARPKPVAHFSRICPSLLTQANSLFPGSYCLELSIRTCFICQKAQRNHCNDCL